MAYAVVPRVARFVSAVSGYNPQAYEPKDFARQSWLEAKGGLLVPNVPLEIIVNVLLFLLVAILWLGVASPGPSRRR